MHVNRYICKPNYDMMTALKENHLKDLNGNLSNTLQGEDARNGYAPANPGDGNPYTEAENPSDNSAQDNSIGSDPTRDEAFGENAGIYQTSNLSNSNITPGPGDEDDDDLDDDDEFLDDDDEGTLIPIEGDEEDDDTLLSADEDQDVIPGTDLDDDELIDEDDDSDISRASLGDLGSNNTRRNTGRSTGRMTDHEPGTSEI
jgi:hypothetical protein